MKFLHNVYVLPLKFILANVSRVCLVNLTLEQPLMGLWSWKATAAAPRDASGVQLLAAAPYLPPRSDPRSRRMLSSVQISRVGSSLLVAARYQPRYQQCARPILHLLSRGCSHIFVWQNSKATTFLFWTNVI